MNAARDRAYFRAVWKIEEARRTGAKELDLRPPYDVEDSEILDELQDSLGQLTHLQSLDLSNNQLTALPECLGQLTQLRVLIIAGNQLVKLPESLGQLAALQTLKLSGNQLAALPESLGRLTQLEVLDISSNRLKALPESLDGLTQLQSMVLSGNRLTALPVELGQLTRLQSLNLSANQLTTLPESLGQLTKLRSLKLSRNHLTALPASLGQLGHLEDLDASHNWLKGLPGSMGKLLQLQWLDLSGNELMELPDSLGQLSQLQGLDLCFNKLTMLPASFARLVGLKQLLLGSTMRQLDKNVKRAVPGARETVRIVLPRLPPSDEEKRNKETRLGTVPDCIRFMTELTALGLGSCNLTALPEWLTELRSLGYLDLRGNPLNPDLAAAYEEGFEAVKRYLRELAKGAKKRYEAKLLILGDGNEGKTCVSRALRGLPFRKQNTTRGVDVLQWKFPHPDDAANREKEITLNIWDFEGQEISHQTHQFFLSSQSLYLLVFRCRDQFLMDRAEYWLDTIRARAPKAKVAIVITQCEERVPVAPLDIIQTQYGGLLAEEWFFPIGCEDGTNIAKLRAYLQRWAADLEFMGSEWPTSYCEAEAELKTKAKKKTAQITRKKLEGVFAKAGVGKDGYNDAATAMSRLGIITQFPDCPDLRDFVVLRPQWLTKAISKVMEDKKLSADQGEIALERMEAMWKKPYPGMFATFHDCMKEFELCYDLEDGSRSCLVPLRFGYLKPEIPWSNMANLKVRRVEYKLNIRPPMGIMSRFIVKTHHMIVKTAANPKGVYWHNGVFLRSGEGPLCSEALCEFVPEERKLRIEVRAAYPQNLCEQIHAYARAVFSFFEGMTAERSYGCIHLNDQTGEETPCTAMHTEKRIYAAISKQRPIMDCEFEDHEIDPRRLVWGFSSFSEFVMARVVPVRDLRRELDKQPEWAVPFILGVESLQEWVNANGGKLDQLLQKQAELSAEFKQEAELKLHEYLELINKLLDDRAATATPGIFSLNTKDRSRWNPAGYFKLTYVLTPFCECKGNIHPCQDGEVEFTKGREWWEETAPWIARGTKLLSAGLTLAFAGMPLALGRETFDVIKEDVDFMRELAKHLELEDDVEKALTSDEQGELGERWKEVTAKDTKSRLARMALSRLLEDVAPKFYGKPQWGSLRRLRLSDGSYRWLCEDCTQKCR